MNKFKNIIWLCTIIILISALSINNLIIKSFLIILSTIIALLYMYKNASNLTSLSKENVKIKTFKNIIIITTIFIIFIFTICTFANYFKEETFENMLLISFTLYFIYFGNESPKIPCNSYLGLRLPYTVNNEDVWRYAHKIVGYTAFPCSIFMFLIGKFYNFKLGIIVGPLLIFIVPSILSYKFYKKLLA